ncbi:hypothetical protein [Pseudobutyrivibrio xylanivorans]|nr:hypothetical protein [Pseudobutyrivibrio xylanivorans]
MAMRKLKGINWTDEICFFFINSPSGILPSKYCAFVSTTKKKYYYKTIVK